MYSELLFPSNYNDITARSSNNSRPEAFPKSSGQFPNEMVSTSMIFLHQILQRRIENIEKSLVNTNKNLASTTNLRITSSKSFHIPATPSASQVSDISSGRFRKRVGYVRNVHRKVGSTQSLPVGNISVDNSYLLLGKNVNFDPSNSSIYIKEFLILKHADKYNAIFEAEASKPKQKIKLKELLPVPKKNTNKRWTLKTFFLKLMKKSKKLDPIIEENFDFENQTDFSNDSCQYNETIASEPQCVNQINTLRETLLLDSITNDNINHKLEYLNDKLPKPIRNSVEEIHTPLLEQRRILGEITDPRFRCTHVEESPTDSSRTSSRTFSEKITTISRKIPSFNFHRKKTQSKKAFRKCKKENIDQMKQTKSECKTSRSPSLPKLKPVTSTVSFICRKPKTKIPKPLPKVSKIHLPKSHQPKIRESQSKLSVCSIEDDDESPPESLPSRKEVPKLKTPKLILSNSNFSNKSSRLSLTKEACFFYDSNVNQLYNQQIFAENPKCFYSSSLSTLYSTLSERTMISERSSTSCFQMNHVHGFVHKSKYSVSNTKATSTSKLMGDNNETHVDISVVIRNPIQEEPNSCNEENGGETLGTKTLTIPLVVPISSGRNLVAGPVRLD